MYLKKEDAKFNEATSVFGGMGSIFSRDLWPEELFPKQSGKFLRHVCLPAGSSLGEHTHSGEYELFYALSGEVEAKDGDETVILRPGDVLLTGNGRSHALFNKGDQPFEMVSIILYSKE